jgi:hypothetical protein
MLALGCQGEPNVPSEPGRGVELAAPGGCLDPAFNAASAVYTNSQVRNAKLKACKTIEAFVKRNQIGKAELEIDKLLVAIHSDYQDGTAALALVPPDASVEQSVADYIGAACGLAPLDASDCLLPNDLDNDGIDAADLDGWIAAGPLSGTATALATGLLENALFAFGVEGGPAYVTVAQRPATGVDGPCPEEFAFDCQDDVFDVDVDGVFTWVTVESCTDFGKKHAHCPEGQPCAFGVTTTPLALINDNACTSVAYNEMGFLGRFAYQATKPAQWVIHATPAYAGTSTKFGAFSPIVLADDLPRTRGVDCIISNSQFNSGSAGSTCRLLNGTTQIAQCTTAATGENSSRCTLSPPIPDDIIVLVTVEKTGGDGAYNAASAPFEIGPANPARGEDNKQTCFQMTPPTAQQVSCP